MTPDRSAELLARLAATSAGIVVKGAKTRYCAVNGNMFAFVPPEGGLCLRLDEAGKRAFNAAHGTAEVIQHGAVMRGYVAVPAALAADGAALAALWAEVVEHARALPPKATTRKGPRKKT